MERGETVIITRHGRPIARLVPEAALRRDEIEAAIESLIALRKRTGKISVKDLLSARDEGRKS